MSSRASSSEIDKLDNEELDDVDTHSEEEDDSETPARLVAGKVLICHVEVGESEEYIKVAGIHGFVEELHTGGQGVLIGAEGCGQVLEEERETKEGADLVLGVVA
jgi:hypothetical protein